MRCPFCQGQHWVVRGGQMMPCPECGGVGEVHCCEGMVARMSLETEPVCQPERRPWAERLPLASPSADCRCA